MSHPLPSSHSRVRAVRIASTLTFLTSAAVGGCSCGSSEAPALPGPTHAAFTAVAASSVSALGVTPFDVDRRDLVGPNSHDAQYGKTPEIVAVPGAGFIDVVLRSNDDPSATRAFYVRITDSGGTLALGQAMEIPSLGLLMGFTRAADGTFYYATGTYDDDVSSSYPSNGVHRANVVRVYHFDASGQVLFDVDLDTARGLVDDTSEAIINPGVASSSRLAVAGDVLALVHGINTNPDWSINGTRHQKALSTYLDATTGVVRTTSGIWMSHSFDQRYLVDGNALVELHLGDAYDRAIRYSRVTGAHAASGVSVYFPKGALGANNTRTRLGDIVLVPGASDGSMLAAVASERTPGSDEVVSGCRDLGLVRTNASGLDSSFGTAIAVSSAGFDKTNHVLFLTDCEATSASMSHAERPKLVTVSSTELLVLWENWTYAIGGTSQTFDGTYAMRIDASGTITAAATRVSDHHLPRGDDAFAYDGGAAWITGDEMLMELTLHVVASDLAITERVLH